MTEENKNKIVIFDLPEDATTADIINEILKNNNLKEGTEEFFNKLKGGQESNLEIVRDTALVLFEQKVPEEKLAEIMAEHLETSKENAIKVILDIKKKLLPYAKKITVEKENQQTQVEEEPSTQELLIEKIKQGIPDDKAVPQESLLQTEEMVKKLEVKDVEENADDLKKQREEKARVGTTGGELQRKGQNDKYREAID